MLMHSSLKRIFIKIKLSILPFLHFPDILAGLKCTSHLLSLVLIFPLLYLPQMFIIYGPKLSRHNALCAKREIEDRKSRRMRVSSLPLLRLIKGTHKS